MAQVGVVVSNTTPLIALAWLEQLDLLPMLFESVYIPQAVGILMEARKRGLIGPLRPLLDRLRDLPFRMTQTLYFDVLHQAGDWP